MIALRLRLCRTDKTSSTIFCVDAPWNQFTSCNSGDDINRLARRNRKTSNTVKMTDISNFFIRLIIESNNMLSNVKRQCDNILPDFLKHLDAKAENWLARLFTQIQRSGRLPILWKRARIIITTGCLKARFYRVACTTSTRATSHQQNRMWILRRRYCHGLSIELLRNNWESPQRWPRKAIRIFQKLATTFKRWQKCFMRLPHEQQTGKSSTTPDSTMTTYDTKNF